VCQARLGQPKIGRLAWAPPRYLSFSDCLGFTFRALAAQLKCGTIYG
jgi:hypothetical protein